MRILIETDAALVGMAGGLARSAAMTGLTFPAVLLLWRCAFYVTCTALLLAVAYRVTPQSGVTAAVLIAVCALQMETLRRYGTPLYRDAKREWDRRMFSRYAAICDFKRRTQRPVRFVSAVMAAGAAGFGAVAVANGEVEGEAAFAMCVVVALSAAAFLGGYLEACEPPLPGSGDRSPSAILHGARA